MNDIEISPGQIWRDAEKRNRFVRVEAVLPDGSVRIRTCDHDGHITGSHATKAAYYRFAFVAGQRTGAGYRLVKEKAAPGNGAA